MTATTTRTLGATGEEIAARYLVGLGWQVLQRNWRCREGEIDLIARDPDSTVVFVEVKCRSGLGFGDPLEAITYAKLARLRRLAAAWLAEHGGAVARIRVDAIGVLLVRGQQHQVRHLQGITS